MNVNWKSTTAWAGIGGLVGAAAVTALSAHQVDVASHWLEIVVSVAGCVVAGAGAILAVFKRKGTPS